MINWPLSSWRNNINLPPLSGTRIWLVFLGQRYKSYSFKVNKGLDRSKLFTWWLHYAKLALFKHTRSHSEPDTVSPLSDPEKLVRRANSKRKLQPYSSSSLTLQSADILPFDPFFNIPSNRDWTKLSPRVSELLDRGVDLKLAFLIHSLEKCQEPPLPIGSPKFESDLGVHLPEYKPT